MSDGDKKTKDSGSNTMIIGVLVVALLGGAGYGYMQLQSKDAKIDELVQANMDLEQETFRIDAKRRKALLGQKLARMDLETLKETGLIPRKPVDKSTVKSYEIGHLLEMWKILHVKGEKMKKGFGREYMSDEETQNAILTDDFNGVRGPDIEEIKAFEAMMSTGDFPLLEMIYNINILEMIESSDLGTSRLPFPGVQNLLAFYTTMGDKPSIDFLTEFLTEGPLVAFYGTKFEGKYFYGASDAVVKGIEARIPSSN